MGNEGGKLKGDDTWPPPGFDWVGVSRRPLDDIRRAAPFPGAKGGRGGTLKEAFLVVDQLASVPRALNDPPLNIAGLAASDSALFVSCPYDGTVKVFDAVTMERQAVWTVDRAGPLALDAVGRLWMLQPARSNQPARVVAFDSTGRAADAALQFEDSAAPRSLCWTPDGRLLVADDGPRQQIRRFEQVNGRFREVAPLGVAGGIHAPPAGAIGDLRFNRPAAVACDHDGTIYVAHHGSTGGGSTVLEAYNPAGALRWRLYGLTFVDLADVDPADDRQVFTKEERFEIDYGQPRGREWTYRAYTVDRFRYPQDSRLHIWSAGAWVRRLAGRAFLFAQNMTGDRLQVYRFNARVGETAIPSGLFAKRRIERDGWPPHQPDAGEWIWRDANGNGAFDEGEFDSSSGDAPPSQGWWVDSRGAVWLATRTAGLRRFPFEGLDAMGNPVWRLARMETYPHPVGFREVRRLRYGPHTDTMYLGGTDADHRNQHWKAMGPVLARYDRWLGSGGRATGVTWRTVLPFESGVRGHASCEPMAFDVAGDHLFVAYTGASRALGVKTGRIEVLHASDGATVGHFEPPPDIGEIGLQDIVESIRAHRRADGEHVVFLKDDFKAKIVMYRWRPDAPRFAAEPAEPYGASLTTPQGGRNDNAKSRSVDGDSGDRSRR